VRAQARAPESSTPNATVGDHAFLGFRICLIEHMVAEREEDGLARNAFWSLYDVRMVPEDQVCTFSHEPI
jgi:hypothetical protein